MLSRLRRVGRVDTCTKPVRTSDRSWRRAGVWRTTFRHQGIIVRHHLGPGRR